MRERERERRLARSELREKRTISKEQRRSDEELEYWTWLAMPWWDKRKMVA